jgi:hypothetical protein
MEMSEQAIKRPSNHRGKSAKERVTVLLCENSDGSDKEALIVDRQSLNQHCFKNIKTLPVK